VSWRRTTSGYSSRRKRKRVRRLVFAGIDDMVGASEQLIHVLGVGARRGILTQHGEVCRHLTIKQGQLLQLCAGQLPSPLGPTVQAVKTSVPVWPALRNPLVERMVAMVEGLDQLNIETPELVSIEMPLAGIGSRLSPC